MNDDLTVEHLREWGRRFSNWGRWGPDDELGTLNFLTPERISGAARLARSGLVVSCAWPFDASDGIAPHSALHEPVVEPRPEPTARWGGTCWDAHARVSYDGLAWNDRALADLPAHGARNASIERLGDGIVGRGVLLDLPRRLGIPWLDDGTRILPEDLDGCAEASGVAIETGDILLLRTGRMTRGFLEGFDGYAGGSAPGLSVRCLRWLHERQVAAVATDTWCVEVLPHEVEGLSMPFHRIAVRDLGLLLGESFHLDRLAEACAQDGRYAFLFVGAPLPQSGALGGPVAPLAVK